jgi:hypothetical protein
MGRRLFSRLVDDGVFIAQSHIDEIARSFDSGDDLLACYLMFHYWLKADALGRRARSCASVLNPASVLVPDPSAVAHLRPTSVRADVLDVLLLDEQREMKAFLLHGFEFGFSLSRSRQWSEVAFPNGPMPSLEAMVELQSGIDDDFSRGLICAREAFPDAPWQCSPIFMVEKSTGGYRRINNFSKGCLRAFSVNDTIPDELGTISYASSEDLQRMILDLKAAGHASVWLGKSDIKSAFRLLPIRPADWCSLGFRDTRGAAWLETRLSFGLKQGPRLFSAFSNTVAWLLCHYHVPCINMIDDFAFANAPFDRAVLAQKASGLVFALLGVPMAGDKEVLAVPRMVFLGIMHDTVSETISLPQERIVKLQLLVEGWLARTTATVADLQSLIGHLCFALRAVPQGRIFLRRCYATLAAGLKRCISYAARHSLQIPLGAELLADLRWWARFLKVFNGTRSMHSPCPDLLRAEHIWTDASDLAASGVYKGRYWRLPFVGRLSYLAPPHSSIAAREMFAICVSAKLWAEEFAGNHCVFHCDNKGDVDSFRRCCNANPLTLHFMRVLSYIAVLYDFTFEPQWLRSGDNVLADKVSRLSLSEIAQDIDLAGLQRVEVTWLPPHRLDPNWENDLSALILSARRF